MQIDEICKELLHFWEVEGCNVENPSVEYAKEWVGGKKLNKQKVLAILIDLMRYSNELESPRQEKIFNFTRAMLEDEICFTHKVDSKKAKQIYLDFFIAHVNRHLERLGKVVGHIDEQGNIVYKGRKNA